MHKVIILLLFFHYSHGDCGGRDSGKEIVEILMWSGGSWAGYMGGEYFNTPNYLGHPVDKTEWNCPYDCRVTGDKSKIANVDGVIFEGQPLADYGNTYKWDPPHMPQKYSGQLWINHGYETEHYFNIYADHGYMDYIDTNFTYYLHSQVPITFTCLWGGGNNITDFLKPPPPKSKDKCAVSMVTNCQSGGAVHRTAYTKELMEHMDVHSYGQCLHNRDLPKEMQFPIYSDHGSSMRNKVQIFKQYKFVLVFENNNVTDYVTEKLSNVLQAGSVPVYMGSHNVHPLWTPGEKSIVRTDDFEGPADLAKYLKYACDNDEEYMSYFEWKKNGLSKHFVERFNNCAFYGAECRLCAHVAEHRRNLSKAQSDKVHDRKRVLEESYIAKFTNKAEFIVKAAPNIDLLHEFSISAWIKTNNLESVILEREHLYSIRLVPYSNKAQAFVRLCVGWDQAECFDSSLAVNNHWQHFVVMYKYVEDGTGYVTFWINGVEDISSEIPLKPLNEKDYSKETKDLVIGRQFQGEMDDIAIWKKAISPKQAKNAVWDIYAGYEEGLSAYWSFNHGPVRSRIADTVGGAEGVATDIDFVESLTKPLITVNPFL